VHIGDQLDGGGQHGLRAIVILYLDSHFRDFQ
jgi:hypothetical protein